MNTFHGFLAELNEVVSQRRRVRRREIALRSAATLLVAWAVLGICDWSLTMPILLRIVMVWGGLTGLFWVTYRMLRSRWDVLERPVHVARRATRSRRLVGDVLAAMEYQSTLDAAGLSAVGPPGRLADTGSSQLKQAVIQEVADSLDQIDVSTERLALSRGGWLALGTLLAMVVLVALLAPYSWAHLQRSVGLNVPFPTRTRIVQVTLGHRVWPVNRGRLGPSWVVRNEPTELLWTCAGQQPDDVELWLRDPRSQFQTALEPELLRDAAGQFVYRATLPPLEHAVQLRLRAGDCTSNWTELKAFSRPQVAPQWLVTPPSYSGQTAFATEELQLQVLAGSQVELRLRSDSELESTEARVLAEGEVESRTLEFDTALQAWTLGQEVRALSLVVQPVVVDIQLRDHRGLELATPLRLDIQLLDDQAPTVEAATEYRVAVPSGGVNVVFQATDDFELERIDLEIRLPRRAERPIRRRLWTRNDQAGGGAQPIRDVISQQFIDLSEFSLFPGDELQLTPLASDRRDPLPGVTVAGTPFTITIGDPADVLAEVAQLDAASEEQIEQVIQRVQNATAASPQREGQTNE
jgi:hypothetical protein